jgi:hypothetical protein
MGQGVQRRREMEVWEVRRRVIIGKVQGHREAEGEKDCRALG